MSILQSATERRNWQAKLAVAETDSCSRRPPLSSAAALQLCRRVDWRFLLPDPRLGRVACVGRGAGPLLAALRAFSTSLCEIPGVQLSESDCNAAVFDLVVLSSWRHDGAQLASAVLKADGFVYWEIDRRRWTSRQLRKKMSRPVRPPAFRDYRVALTAAGFSTPLVHWHYPNFEQCEEIIPLSEPASLELFLARRGNKTLSRLARVLPHSRLAGWLARFAPCISLMARKAQERAA